MDDDYFGFFWASMQTIQRVTSTDKAVLGFNTLMFGNTPVVYEDASSMPDKHMYFHQHRLPGKLRYAPDRLFKPVGLSAPGQPGRGDGAHALRRQPHLLEPLASGASARTRETTMTFYATEALDRRATHRRHEHHAEAPAGNHRAGEGFDLRRGGVHLPARRGLDRRRLAGDLQRDHVPDGAFADQRDHGQRARGRRHVGERGLAVRVVSDRRHWPS